MARESAASCARNGGTAREIRALAVIYLDPGCCPLAIAGERFALIESDRRYWWEKRGSFRMSMAGWRLARNRAATALEGWQMICSAVVAAGSMIMLGIMLYNDLQ
jgi:hypothetical protein